MPTIEVPLAPLLELLEREWLPLRRSWSQVGQGGWRAYVSSARQPMNRHYAT